MLAKPLAKFCTPANPFLKMGEGKEGKGEGVERGEGVEGRGTGVEEVWKRGEDKYKKRG
jgi:hypothetical protein